MSTSIRDKVQALEAASRPPRSGPVLQYKLKIKEEQFQSGEHHGTTVGVNGLELTDPATTGYYQAYWSFGRTAREAYLLVDSFINWTASGTVNVYVSRDPATDGWTPVSSASQVPVFDHNAPLLGQNLWVKVELVGGTNPSVSLVELDLTIQTADNNVDAPWPTTPDVADWLWRQATPRFWMELLGRDAYPTTVEFKFFRALVEGVRWARVLLDRQAARYDPHQADTEDLDRLKLWTNADDRIVRSLPDSLVRSYLDSARGLARYRGTELLSELFRRIFGLGVSIAWREDKNPDGSYVYPHRRLVIAAGPVQFGPTKALLRRSFPASVEIELHYINATPPVTGFVWTGFDSSAIGEPPGNYYDYGWTLAEGETVELI